MEKLSWDNFNESMTLKEAVERYKERHGGYPVSIHVDTIYCKRENINYCRERGIRISETVIIMNLIVMNLAFLHRLLFVFFSKSAFRFLRTKILLATSRFLPAAV